MMKKICLFLGDSITDADRNKDDPLDLGKGYVREIAQNLTDAVSINRGVSGYRIRDLVTTLQSSKLEQGLETITLLIGVNDVIHRYKHHQPTEDEEFRFLFQKLMYSIVESSPNKIIVMEPFLLPVLAEDGGAAFVTDGVMWDKMLSELARKREMIRGVCKAYHVKTVRLHDAFWAAEGLHQEWLYDGIHPTPKGHRLIMELWRSA